MEDIIDIIVTETTNTIEITAQPNDEIIDVNIIDNREDITLNVTPTVVEININSLTGNFGILWGEIEGTLSNQTDLQNVLNLKADLVDGKVPSSQLPSYVDDVVEVANYAALPVTGEVGKIYITLDTNFIYRWTGSTYVEIKDSSAVWGAITGTLSNQTDLQNALNAKANDNAVVHLAGTETITGLKTFSGGLIANVSTGGNQGFASTNTSTSATSVFVQNNSTGIGILANNASTGDAILIGNDTSGRGIYITNATLSGSGKGISIDNYNSGIGIEIGSNSSADAIKVLHLAGRAFNIQSSGGGYGVIINNTTASTSAPFTIQKQGVDRIVFTDAGAGTFNSSLTANSLVKSGGTSSQFLKADGSVDSSTYLTTANAASNYVPYSGATATVDLGNNNLEINGTTTYVRVQGGSASGFISESSGSKMQLNPDSLILTEKQSSPNYTKSLIFRTTILTANYSIVVPNSSGTLALTSQLSAYLPLAGGTLTGALNGTSALFSGAVRANNPSEGATGEGLIAGQSFKIDGTGTSQKAVMYMVSNVLSDTYASGLTAQYANFAGDKAFGFNLNTSGGFELYVKNTTFNKAITVANSGAVTLTSALSGTSATFSGTFTTNGISVVNSDVHQASTVGIYWGAPSTYVIGVTGNTSNGNLSFITGSTVKLSIASTGAATFSSSVSATSVALNGSIANSADASTLTIKQTSTSYNNGIYLERGGERNGYHMYIGGALDSLTFRRNYFGTQSDVMSLTRDGNVGIGTTAPTSLLDVKGSASIISLNNTSTGSFSSVVYKYLDSYLGEIGATAGSGQMQINMGPSAGWGGFITFKTDTSERMRITSGGNVLVGQSTATLGANGWQLQGVGGGHCVFQITNNEAFIYNNRTSGTFYKVDFRTLDVSRGNINVTDTLVTYNTTSDYRLKEDLKPINGLEIVNKIKVYDYKWKASNERMDGVMAHELAEILPYAVQGVKDGEQMQSVDYSKIVPVMVQAIKDLKAELDTLKNK